MIERPISYSWLRKGCMDYKGCTGYMLWLHMGCMDCMLHMGCMDCMPHMGYGLWQRTDCMLWLRTGYRHWPHTGCTDYRQHTG